MVGLGNPGEKYSGTRHNIGYLVADELALRYSGKFTSNKYRALVLETRAGIGGSSPKMIVVKPETYMNDSGAAVAPLAQYFNCAPDQVIAIHDELDIPFNTLDRKSTRLNSSHT